MNTQAISSLEDIWPRQAELNARAGFDTQALGSALLMSGIVNLSDNEFSTTTSPDKVEEWAKGNKARWHGQIRKWQPRIVLCGGTFNPVWRALGKPEWDKASTGTEYFLDPSVPGCVYVETPHPSARYPVRMVYTYLMASAGEILTRTKHKR